MAGRALDITKGGTGQTTAEGARIAFGLGPNDDVVFNSLTVNSLTAGSMSLSGDLDLNGNDIQDGGDIFLQSGKKIDWNAGDVTLTHSANTLTFAGASSGVIIDGGTTQVPFIVQQSDDGASAGPNIRLERISTTPATSDLLGSIDFVGRDSGGAQQRYARMSGHILVPTAGIESGTIRVNLTIAGVDTAMYSFDIASFRPITNDVGSLGTTSTSWADLFLATGGVINWNAGDVTITHSADTLAFGGAASGYTFSHVIKPSANDGAALGVSGTAWSDLFLASGGVIDFNAGNFTLTHSADVLTANKDIRVTTAGTNAASVVTVDGTQTLGNKTLTTPTLILKQSSGPTPTAEGDIQWDTDDNVLVIGDGSASRRGSPWELISSISLPNGTASVAWTDLSAFRLLRLDYHVRPATDAVVHNLRYSVDNGANYKSGASDYHDYYLFSSNAAAPAATSSNSDRWDQSITSVGNVAPSEGVAGYYQISEWNQADECFVIGNTYLVSSTPTFNMGVWGGRSNNNYGARNALRFAMSSGNIADGFLMLQGVRG